MKVRTLAAFACVIGTVLSSGCGGSGPKELNMKGLHLGMDIKEAHQIFEKLLEGTDNKVGEIKDGEIAFATLGEHPKNKYFNFFMQDGVEANSKGEVFVFIIPGMIVKKMFNVGDMEVSDFAVKFAESYSIPGFKVTDDGENYYFDSPHGYRIEIDKYKALLIKATTPASGQKFD